MPKPRLLLLGGGHAHVQVVRAFGTLPPAACDVMLVSSDRFTPYSGMLPGHVAEHYRHDEAHIDLATLCDRTGVDFVEQNASAIDLELRCIHTSAGHRIEYDLLSIDTGSTTPVAALPGAVEHGIPVKPVAGFLLGIQRMLEAVSAGNVRSIAVIGAGAAGVEIALAIDHRLSRTLGVRHRPILHLYTDAPHILPVFPTRARRCVERILAERRIEVHAHANTTAVGPGNLEFADGASAAHDVIFLATGAAPDPMFRLAGLRTDAHGFIQVHSTLQSVSHPNIFACGDVASVAEHPRPKAGVFAVRQGPPLTENLRRAVMHAPLVPFVPQREFLVLLSTGNKYAIAVRNGWMLQGAWVWRWKDRIDRRFMASFAADARTGSR